MPGSCQLWKTWWMILGINCARVSSLSLKSSATCVWVMAMPECWKNICLNTKRRATIHTVAVKPAAMASRIRIRGGVRIIVISEESDWRHGLLNMGRSERCPLRVRGRKRSTVAGDALPISQWDIQEVLMPSSLGESVFLSRQVLFIAIPWRELEDPPFLSKSHFCVGKICFGRKIVSLVALEAFHNKVRCVADADDVTMLSAFKKTMGAHP